MASTRATRKEIQHFKQKLKDYNYSAHVVYYYPKELQKFLEYSKINPEDADIEYVIAYRNHLQEKGLSKGTVNKKLTVLKTWYKFKYDENPLDETWKERMIVIGNIRDNRRGIGKESSWKPIEIEWLRELVKASERLSQPDNCEIECFIKLLVFTGGRAQFYGLQWANVDFDDEMIRLLVKGRKKHEIPMVSELKDVLLRHRKNCNKNAEFVFSRGKKVYVEGDKERSVKNQRANLKNAERIVDRVAALAGLTHYNKKGKLVSGEKITPHRLRKTLAHEGGKLGLSLEVVHDILGHSSMEVTKRAYRGRQHGRTKQEMEKADLLGRKEKKVVNVDDLTYDEQQQLLRELLAKT